MHAKRLQHFLKDRRDALELSQEVVAERLEISVRAYGNWERGTLKEWTDEKLYALADALEMSHFQTARLFWYAVGRAPQPDLRAMFRRSKAEDPATSAFMGDYSVMMDALSLPIHEADRTYHEGEARELCHTGPKTSLQRRRLIEDHPQSLLITSDYPEADQVDTENTLAVEMRAERLQHFLKGRRDYLELSQEDVAERLEISVRAYGNWERGTLKEWTDEKLYALADALEMSHFQTARLFWYAVGRAPQPDLRAMFRRSKAEDPATSAFMGDYSVMMDALSLPTFVIDHRWDVKMANKAYRDLFRDVRAHPTAMPASNFLRFGLFHPDAPTVLVDHLKWQLAMLAQLSSSLERHDEDPRLQAIRRDVYLHPPLRDAYLTDMPNWVLGSGADLVHHEGAVRELRHPDPHIGLQGCRLVEETPRFLRALGLTRLTLVLVDLGDRPMSGRCRSHEHHAA